MTTARRVLDAMRLAEPPLGMATSVVAIDGYGGAGKSTLAAAVCRLLLAGGRRTDVVHTDDFASADNPLDWWPRLITQVLDPLRAGAPARYRRHDWTLGRLAEWNSVEPGGVVLLEGVSASRLAFRPYLSLAVWVETPADERLRRGLERDGAQARDQWLRWMADEVAWGDSERPWAQADVVVPGIPRA